MNNPLVSVLSLGFGVLVACAPQQAPSSTQADEEAIRRVNQEWAAAFAASDLDQSLAPLTSDAMFLPENAPAVSGAESLRSWFSNWYATLTLTDVRILIDELVISGDLAFTRGTFTARLQPRAGGEAFTEAARYILIWRRQPDGSWKIARDIWNSDTPPPSSP